MVRLIQNNFVSGVISPSLYGRSDLSAYYRGLADAENYVVSKTGSLRKRHGVGTVATPAGWIPLKAFAYRYDRTDGAVALVCWVPDSEGAQRGSVRIALFSKSGSIISSAGVRRLVEDSFDRTADLSWARRANCTQVGDTLYITCERFFREVVVTVPASGVSGAVLGVPQAFSPAQKPDRVESFSAVGRKPDGSSYDGDGETSVGYMASICSGGVLSEFRKASAYQKKSWEAGAYTDITLRISEQQQADGFDYVVVGKSVGGTYGELTRFYPEDFVTSAGAPTRSVSYTDKNVSAGAGVYRQSDVLSIDSNTPFHPLCVCAFQQRFVFANAETKAGKSPMTLWFSEIGNLKNFWADRPVNDDDPFSPTIVSPGPAFIRWTCAFQDSLVCFTDGGIFDIRSDSTQNGFSSTTCKMTLVSDVCCSHVVAPVVTTAGIVFVGADDKTVYTVSYDLQSDSKKPTDRMVLASHLTRRARIVSMALQSYPDTVVWCVLEDGSALSFTHQPEQEVYAWSRHSFPGLRMRQVVGLGTVTDSTSDYTRGDVVFLAETESGGTVFAVPRADWQDVVGGVARPVEAAFETLRPESQDRTIAGRHKNVKDVLVRIHESGPLSVLPASGTVPARPIRLPAGATTASGDFKVMPSGYVTDDGRMRFASADALPSEVLAVVYDMEVAS